MESIMKKIWGFTILVVLSLFLCACGAEAPEGEIEEINNTPVETINIHFRNEVQEADAWIIPNTEENRGTSLWGTATVAKSTPGTEYTARVTRSETDEYLLYMIDVGGMYYDSGAITLLEDYTVTISEAEDEVQLAIADAAGETIFKKSIFKAAL